MQAGFWEAGFWWLLQGQARALQEAVDVVYGPAVPWGAATGRSPLLLGTHRGLLLLLPPSISAQRCPSPCCNPPRACLCRWQPKMLLRLGKRRGCGSLSPRPRSIPSARGGGADFAQGKFCTGRAPPVPEGCSTGGNGHHVPALPQWATTGGSGLLSHGKPPFWTCHGQVWAWQGSKREQRCLGIFGKPLGRDSPGRDSPSLGREGSSWGWAAGRGT